MKPIETLRAALAKTSSGASTLARGAEKVQKPLDKVQAVGSPILSAGSFIFSPLAAGTAAIGVASVAVDATKKGGKAVSATARHAEDATHMSASEIKDAAVASMKDSIPAQAIAHPQQTARAAKESIQQDGVAASLDKFNATPTGQAANLALKATPVVPNLEAVSGYAKAVSWVKNKLNGGKQATQPDTDRDIISNPHGTEAEPLTATARRDQIGPRQDRDTITAHDRANAPKKLTKTVDADDPWAGITEMEAQDPNAQDPSELRASDKTSRPTTPETPQQRPDSPRKPAAQVDIDDDPWAGITEMDAQDPNVPEQSDLRASDKTSHTAGQDTPQYDRSQTATPRFTDASISRSSSSNSLDSIAGNKPQAAVMTDKMEAKHLTDDRKVKAPAPTPADMRGTNSETIRGA